jgi:N-acetylneuraminate synthase
MPGNTSGNGAKPGPPNPGSKGPSFVAEVSSNHHRDLERCLEFIRTAAGIGCDAVKFQLFRVRELFAPEALRHNPNLLARETWELPIEFLARLAKGCAEAGIRFSCTPFYLEAVEELLPFVDFYKVASYELMWDDLLQACARTGKPVVLSTGMATLPEVNHACSILRSAGCRDLTLLHCVSTYPTKPEDCNLAAIASLRESCQCPVGWSDHSVDPGVIFRAVHRWGATMVEFHLDLEGQGAEFSAGHCWLPEAMRQVIAAVRTGIDAEGDGRVGPALSEVAEREWRADPEDGLRPLRATRRNLGQA